MTRALSVAQVIAGEATSGTEEQRIADMRAIASVIANRATQLGVTPEQVVASGEFDAYNSRLPPGVGDNLVALAQEQIDYVAENGPVNNATFYATPSAVDGLPNGLSYETETAGHQFFSDPQGRAIGTSEGYRTPNEFSYAQNLDVTGVPTPYAADDLANNSLMSAFSTTPTYSEDPFSAVLSGSQPAVNQWDAMASAAPVQSPMGSVQASGLLASNPALAANATARPMMDLAATADLGTNPGLLAESAVRGLPDLATVSSRMGIAEPGFDQSRFDGDAISVASGFDPGRFADPTNAAFDQSRFGPPSIDVATNTQSFADQPAMAANLGSFPGGLMAQREVAQPAMAAVDTSQFDQSRFGPDLANFDMSRFGPTPDVAFDPSRFGPSLVDPATNTASFVDQPAAPAQIASFADAMAAQRGAPTGLESAEAQAMQGHVAYAAQKAREDAQLNSLPSLNVPAAGLLAANAPMEAQAVASVPANDVAAATPTFDPSRFASLVDPATNVTSFADQPAVAPAEQAITDNFTTGAVTPGLLSASPISTANAPLSFTPSQGIIGAQPVQQNAFVDSFPDAVANNTIEPAAVNDVVAAPTLDTMQVADQPTIAGAETMPAPMTAENDVQPATTEAAITAPAVTPQTMTEAAAKPTLASSIEKMANPGTLTGGVLGALALGPAGGLLGGLLGNSISQNGGIQGLLGNSFSAPTTQMAGGINNIASIYGGSVAPGTYAMANNGAQITAQPGGYSTYTNKYGTTNAVGPDGKISAYFGGGLFSGRDPEAPTPSGTGASGGYAIA